MKPQKGYYSIIQYCPDLSRFEAANIGVLLFCPESRFLKAMTTRHNRRITKFFGQEGHDWKRLRTFKKGLEDRVTKEQSTIRTLDDLQQFIAMRANQIQITDPRPMKVFDPEKDLAELFEKLMGEPPKRETRTSLKKLLAETFSTAGVDKKIVSDVKVHVPVLGKEVEMPFGFQNGRFNVIKPVSFGGSDPDSALPRACKYAVEGRSIYEHPNPEWGEMQLFVVGQFRTTEVSSLVRRVLRENEVKVYSASEDELAKLADEIRRTGKEIDGSLAT